MVQFKVCMVGCYAVGKTSLVERFVRGAYSDAYHTTIGVKIDKAVVTVDDTEATCVLWDIAGEDEFYTVRNSYLRGLAGYFLVLDGTRRVTLDIGERIQERIEAQHGKVPAVLLVNKDDLESEWEIADADLQPLRDQGVPVIHTSAKTGGGVERAFQALVESMMALRGRA